jgi:hypothetical protein
MVLVYHYTTKEGADGIRQRDPFDETPFWPENFQTNFYPQDLDQFT